MGKAKREKVNRVIHTRETRRDITKVRESETLERKNAT